MFPETPFRGSISNFDDIFLDQSFIDRLNIFFRIYLKSVFDDLYKHILLKIGEFCITDFEKIHLIANNKNFPSWKSHGHESKHALRLFNSYLYLFKGIYDFYSNLNILIKEKLFIQKGGLLIYQVNSKTNRKFDSFIESYFDLINKFKIPINVELLNFRTNKKLSSGEKAILNFYSIIK